MDTTPVIALALALLGLDGPRLDWPDATLVQRYFDDAGNRVEAVVEQWACRTAPYAVAAGMPSRCIGAIAISGTPTAACVRGRGGIGRPGIRRPCIQAPGSPD